MKNQELIILGVLVVAIIYLVFFNQNGNEGFATTTNNKENLASYCDIHKNEGNCIQKCVDGQNCIEDTDYQLCKWSRGSCSANSRECL